jgi:hypothetical protein
MTGNLVVWLETPPTSPWQPSSARGGNRQMTFTRAPPYDAASTGQMNQRNCEAGSVSLKGASVRYTGPFGREASLKDQFESLLQVRHLSRMMEPQRGVVRINFSWATAGTADKNYTVVWMIRSFDY